jgi:lipoprotein-anchoring transpeptidase ErfK/SrfK
MMFRIRPIFYILLSISIIGVGLSGCTGPLKAAPLSTPVPTVAYLPPTIIPFTPTPIPTDLPAATATPRPRSSPTAAPSYPQPQGGVPNISGQLILVSINQQWLWAYQNRQIAFNTPVTTGQPELPTPSGTYSVLSKLTNVTFISPWPSDSPYYYEPEQVNYALYFLSGGYYIHDAPWRKVFGPGSNVPHTAPDGTQETGSHGCVNVPTSAGAWLYNWAKVGATILIVGSTPSPVATPTPSISTDTPSPTPNKQ